MSYTVRFQVYRGARQGEGYVPVFRQGRNVDSLRITSTSRAHELLQE